MRNMLYRAAALAACASLAGFCWAAESLEEVEKRLAEQNAAIKSISADVALRTEVMGAKGEGFGKLESVRDGDVVKLRSEVKITQSIPGGEKIEVSSFQVVDGRNIYSYKEFMGQKVATKEDLDARNSMLVSKAFFDALRRDTEVRLLADDTIEGKPVTVIESTPKTSDAKYGRMTFAFAKDTGVMMRVITHSADGPPQQVLEFKNVQLNPPLGPERFTFTAPEGVEVRDMTSKEQPAREQPKTEKPKQP